MTLTLESTADGNVVKTETLTIDIFDWTGGTFTGTEQVFLGTSNSFFLLPKISPTPATTYTYAIKMRKQVGSNLTWVTLEDQVADTKVLIDASTVASGTYTLDLEYFDDNSTDKPTIKTSAITINAVDFIRS